jgi:hypothetical protein
MGQALAWGNGPSAPILSSSPRAPDANLSPNRHQTAGKHGAQFRVVTKRSTGYRPSQFGESAGTTKPISKVHPMRAIKEARKFIEQEPDNPSAQTLSRLVLALESEADFPISDIYKLDFERFALALKILDEWRLDRYYAGKARLFDVSLQTVAINRADPQT